MDRVYLNLPDDEFRELYKNDTEAALIDVRMKEEFDEDRICDSILCDYTKLEDFKSFLKCLDVNKHYYVYCMTGHRSIEACEMMKEMGFKYLVGLKGGMIRFNGKICTD